MAIRPFGGVQSIGASAAPVFGTTLTAAFTPRPDPFSGNLNPGSNQTQGQLAVTSTTGFNVGDRILVGAAAAFNPGLATTLADLGVIKQVVSGTVLLVQGLLNAHAANEYVVLNEEVAHVAIAPVGGTAGNLMYIGNAPTVAAGDASVFDVLTVPATGASGVGPNYIHNSPAVGGAQPYQTVTYWIAGTAADKFVARFTQV